MVQPHPQTVIPKGLCLCCLSIYTWMPVLIKDSYIHDPNPILRFSFFKLTILIQVIKRMLRGSDVPTSSTRGRGSDTWNGRSYRTDIGREDDKKKGCKRCVFYLSPFSWPWKGLTYLLFTIYKDEVNLFRFLLMDAHSPYSHLTLYMSSIRK